MGIFRLMVDTPVSLKVAGFEAGYPEGSFLWIVNNMFFQYYSLAITLVCIVVMLAVSYATAPPSYEKISGLTFGTMTAADHAESRASWDWRDIASSILVLVLILLAYLYFTG